MSKKQLADKQKMFRNKVRAWFHSYNLDPVLKVQGNTLRIGNRFSLHDLGNGNMYMLGNTDHTSTTRSTGTLDCLLRAIVGKFVCFTELPNHLDKKAVRTLIAADMVTEKFLQQHLLKEYKAEVEHARKQMIQKSRRLGLKPIPTTNR